MTPLRSILLLNAIACLFLCPFHADAQSYSEKHDGYEIFFTTADRENVGDYSEMIDNGMKSIEAFFGHPFMNEFKVFVHPQRSSLDSAWQNDWNMPEFRSECWMVASGIASKLDILSPKQWDSESCEHTYDDSEKTKKLVAHELVHVYHGQRNASPDFSAVSGIDWFVEGLAVYASGQLDSLRMAEVRTAVKESRIPDSLAHFWSGKLKYGLSGSAVKYIDTRYGRMMLADLLPLSNIGEVLSELQISESALLADWREFILSAD